MRCFFTILFLVAVVSAEAQFSRSLAFRGAAVSKAAGSTPTQVASDNFNRSDASTLGANWLNLESSPTIAVSNNTAILKTDGFAPAKWAGTGSFNNDQYSQITLKFVKHNGGEDDVVDVTVRAQGTTGTYDFYGCSFSSDFYELYHNSVGDIIAPTTHTFSSGDVVRLSVVGSTLTITVNGVYLNSATDSSLTSGVPGFNLYRNVSTAVPVADDWSGGNM